MVIKNENKQAVWFELYNLNQQRVSFKTGPKRYFVERYGKKVTQYEGTPNPTERGTQEQGSIQ